MPGRIERALQIAGQCGAGSVLLAHPSSVMWASGFQAEIETGPSPFAASPLALLRDDGTVVLVVSEDEAARADQLDCDVISYPGFTLEELDPVGGARRALRKAVGDERVATELGALPAAFAQDIDVVDASAGLAQARAVKDADELQRIRAAVRLCDIGQAAARSLATPGLTELELWTGIRGAMEQVAGRVSILADLVSGPRTAEVGGAPGTRRLREGDLILCDLVPRLEGYWGDSCATFSLGEPRSSSRDAHMRALDALARAVDGVGPGVRVSDLDANVRLGLNYPHHTGHGLGTSYHEEPRVVPSGDTVLEPGMVIALEPGLYSGDEGIRVEQVVIVTDNGCDVISGHDLAL